MRCICNQALYILLLKWHLKSSSGIIWSKLWYIFSVYSLNLKNILGHVSKMDLLIKEKTRDTETSCENNRSALIIDNTYQHCALFARKSLHTRNIFYSQNYNFSFLSSVETWLILLWFWNYYFNNFYNGLNIWIKELHQLNGMVWTMCVST